MYHTFFVSLINLHMHEYDQESGISNMEFDVSFLPENKIVANVVAEILVGLCYSAAAAIAVAPERGGGGGGAGGGVAPLERLVVRAGREGGADGAHVVVVEEAAAVTILHRPVLQRVGRRRYGRRTKGGGY